MKEVLTDKERDRITIAAIHNRQINALVPAKLRLCMQRIRRLKLKMKETIDVENRRLRTNSKEVARMN